MAHDQPGSAASNRRSVSATGGWTGFLIGPVFFLLAVWFVWGADISSVPIEESPTVRLSDISTAPRRESPVKESGLVHINGFDRTCMDCHRIFSTTSTMSRKDRLQHQHVVLDHGSNVNCFTCHDREDRDLLVLPDGTTAPLTATELLCSKCHSRAYADWQDGMHGRTNGFFEPARGRLTRLTCGQCHDPHDPTYPARGPIRPLPGPRTLRMGDPAEHAPAHDAAERDPLRALLDGPLPSGPKGESQ